MARRWVAESVPNLMLVETVDSEKVRGKLLEQHAFWRSCVRVCVCWGGGREGGEREGRGGGTHRHTF